MLVGTLNPTRTDRHQQQLQMAADQIPTDKPAEIVDLAALPAIPCPCGTARRAFGGRDEFPGTVHLTEISKDAKLHYHAHHCEVYVIMECEEDAQIELDGQTYPVKPMTSVLIPPGVRHRALGHMKAIIISTPNFDPNDEHFD